MPRRGTLIAYVRRDDAVAEVPTVLVPTSWYLERADRIGAITLASVWPLGREGSSVIGGALREHRDVFFHAWLLVAHASLPRALFVLTGHPFVLQHLADMVAADALSWTRTWASLVDLRADATTLAQQVRAQWPVEHIDGGLVRILARVAGFEDDDAEGA
ncbi:hypothetical protein [Sandaracinus amylolyticus]|uniref:Uncharacterized protein n=1 Tax=Sandaracinus amylolyticus TaxID=927083 RepID=A0A0F6W361_9BACT|nr:hypothetical protein [Sandaracinus amylolyticus]AKF06090.1 hypothetical protein DB32_003239 [Sandaracinus amylolyticus]